MGVITFNGVRSDNKSFAAPILVEHQPKYKYPEREYEVTHIPGRNGDLVIDRGSYMNVQREYELAFGDEIEGQYTEMANDLSSWLHSGKGYLRLEDTYEPDYYRLAMYKEEGDIENILHSAGRITINFECKPQRYLKTGDSVLTYTSSQQIIQNPTKHTARPVVKVYGSGEGTISFIPITNNGTVESNITISNIDSYVIIDSELYDCYKESSSGSINKNSTIRFNKGSFPELGAGNSRLMFSGGITKVEVTPRWWTI